MIATLDRIVVLTTLRTEMEAGLVVAALDDAGIAATITGDTTSGFRAEAPGRVQVNIAEADQDRALEVLQQIAAERGNFNWSEAYGDESINDANISAPTSGIGSLKLWRRIAQVLIVIYLGWLSVGFVASAASSLLNLSRKLY